MCHGERRYLQQHTGSQRLVRGRSGGEGPEIGRAATAAVPPAASACPLALPARLGSKKFTVPRLHYACTPSDYGELATLFAYLAGAPDDLRQVLQPLKDAEDLFLIGEPLASLLVQEKHTAGGL